MEKEEIIKAVIELASNKKYLVVVAEKRVCDWIKEYNLYETLNIPNPENDEAL